MSQRLRLRAETARNGMGQAGVGLDAFPPWPRLRRRGRHTVSDNAFKKQR